MDTRIQVCHGDITQQPVEAIVNAANTRLMGGGGVDGAIHRAAGPGLHEECKNLGGCPTGEARITQAYQLPARWVIHTVGPVWNGGSRGEAKKLRSCYHESFVLIREYAIKTVAFPSISTGAYRYPIDDASVIAVESVQQEIAMNPVVEKVVFVCFDTKTFNAYRALL